MYFHWIRKKRKRSFRKLKGCERCKYRYGPICMARQLPVQRLRLWLRHWRKKQRLKCLSRITILKEAHWKVIYSDSPQRSRKLSKLKQSRFGCSHQLYKAELSRYGCRLYKFTSKNHRLDILSGTAKRRKRLQVIWM